MVLCFSLPAAWCWGGAFSDRPFQVDSFIASNFAGAAGTNGTFCTYSLGNTTGGRWKKKQLQLQGLRVAS
jgi:hypothetical protein